MWLGRKYSCRCYMGEKQRKTSLREHCKVEHIFLLSLYKPLPGQTSIVFNFLPNQVTAKFCSCIQGFSLPFLSSTFAEKREPLLCLEVPDIQAGWTYCGQRKESKLLLVVSYALHKSCHVGKVDYQNDLQVRSWGATGWSSFLEGEVMGSPFLCSYREHW